jgi:hypothetical protein
MVRSAYKHIILLICLIALPASSFSQQIEAVVRVDSQHITIGDWLRATLEIRHTADVKLFPPALPDSLGGFEIVRREQPGSQEVNGNVLEKIPFIVTSFDSGMQIIPPLSFSYTVPGDTNMYVVETSPVVINVYGMAIDTTLDIKDIKPPLSVPITFAEILPYIITAILLTGAVWLVWHIVKKRRRGERIIPEAPPRPAHEVALEALQSLESEKLWQRGKVKDYHSQLTDIIRVYIERRFGIMAMEMTSDEILTGFSGQTLSHELQGQLKEMLYRADLVKFAKYQPLALEHENSLAHAYNFVRSTYKGKDETEVKAPAEELVAQ